MAVRSPSAARATAVKIAPLVAVFVRAGGYEPEQDGQKRAQSENHADDQQDEHLGFARKNFTTSRIH